MNQISFRLPMLAALKRYVERAVANGATDLRAISHGNAWAAYFRDPEGNRIELFVDSPWYIAQPCREPLDLDRPDDGDRRRDRGVVPRATFIPPGRRFPGRLRRAACLTAYAFLNQISGGN